MRPAVERRTAWLAWPRARELASSGALAAGFALFWTVVYGGASWLTSQHAFRVRVHMDWELTLPFVTWMSLAYLSLVPLMLLSLFVFRSWREIVPLLVVLVAQTVVAVPFHLLLPVDQAFPQVAPEGIFASAFHLADLLNLEGNDLPSLHVSYAFTVALALGRGRGRSLRGVLILWACVIASASLFLYQHYLADIVSGIVLAGLMMRWLYDRSGSPEFVRVLRAEVICVGEVYLFSRRHLRYLVIGIIIYGRSLLGWRKLRPIRVGFCFLQHIDDLLDGDRPCDGEPTERVDAILEQFARGSFDDSRLGCLGHCLWRDIAAFQRGEDDPRAEIMTLIRRMRRDRVRVKDALLLSEEELLAHHRSTFHHAVNLMLMLGGAELRARDAGDLVEAFGWCSAMRDLRDDLEKGLVNVPSSVIEAARSESLGANDYETLVAAPAVRRWMRQEHRRAVGHLDRFEEELVGLRGKKGEQTLRLFHRSIRRFAENEAKRRGGGRRLAAGDR